MDTENLTCTVDETDDEDREEYVKLQLMHYNTQQSPWLLQKRMPGRGPKALASYLANSQGDIFGGATGFTLWDWLEVEIVWIWDGLRGQGWGRKLMQSIEDAARSRDCNHSHLITWDFEAPDFYQRCGYTIVGRLDDYPPGHTRFWLRKEL